MKPVLGKPLTRRYEDQRFAIYKVHACLQAMAFKAMLANWKIWPIRENQCQTK